MNFYITISIGLLKDNHRERMGNAVWEFMWLIDKITQIDEEGFGWVLGGKPINIKDLRMGTSESTVKRNLRILAKEGYIVVKRASYGLIIKVRKAQKRFGQRVKKSRQVKNDLSDRPDMTYQGVKSDLSGGVKNDLSPTSPNIGRQDNYIDKTDDIPTSSQSERDINQVLNIFYRTINPNINYGNKANRESAKWLIDKYGLEKILEAVKYAVSVQKDRYAPTITTPSQLKEKMAALIKYKLSGEGKGRKIWKSAS